MNNMYNKKSFYLLCVLYICIIVIYTQCDSSECYDVATTPDEPSRNNIGGFWYDQSVVRISSSNSTSGTVTGEIIK